MGNKPLTITFAEPRRADIAAEQQNEIKSIFVGNLPDTATEAKLREVRLEGPGLLQACRLLGICTQLHLFP